MREVEWARLTGPEIRAVAADAEALAILPVGSLEQHGPHLPVIADSRQALVLREASYPPVQYVPRGDVDMAALERSRHATTCPYKGEASYFTLNHAGQRAENAVWSYEHPHPAVAAIAGHLAFYPDRVESIEES